MRLPALLAALSLILVAAVGAEENGSPYSPYFKTLFNSLHEGDHQALFGWQDAVLGHLDYLEAERGDSYNLENIAIIRSLIETRTIDFGSDDELVGNWQVRSMQADPLGAYVYDWFPARIYYEGQALVFDKNSGSQRHRGLMARADRDLFLFAGALYYGYESPRIYSAHMDGDVTEEDRDRDAIAGLLKLGENQYLMVFAPKGPQSYRFYEMRK